MLYTSHAGDVYTHPSPMFGPRTVNSFSPSQVITQAVRDDICNRCRDLNSMSELSRAIFAGLNASGVNLKFVSLEEMKNIVILAARAYAQKEQSPSDTAA